MSEETVPTSEEEEEIEVEHVLDAAVTTQPVKSPRMFISAGDLASVVDILVKSDGITPEEAVRRLNVMCEKKILLIVPILGRPRK